MKNLFLATCCFIICTNANAQKLDFKKIKFNGNNVVYFEAGGLGLTHSLNYDRRFKKNTPDGFGFRVGVSGLALELGSGGVVIPVGINYIKYILPQMPHAVEIGVGASYYTPRSEYKTATSKSEFISNFSIGYRMQPLEKGLVLKLAYTPHIESGDYYSHWGAAIGYKF